MDFSHIPFPCLSLRFLIKNYCAVWILHSSLFHFPPSPNNQTKESLIFTFPSFFFTPSVSWKKRGICRKMRNFTFIKKSCARIKMATFQEVINVWTSLSTLLDCMEEGYRLLLTFPFVYYISLSND